MQEEKISSGNTSEEVAKALAEDISRNYLTHLQFCHALTTGSPHMLRKWHERMETEPKIVQKNVFDKILDIMQNPRKNKQYFKKKYFFRSKIIRITQSTGFYQDILPGKDIETIFSINVEYIIDTQEMSVVKRIYSQYARL